MSPDGPWVVYGKWVQMESVWSITLDQAGSLKIADLPKILDLVLALADGDRAVCPARSGLECPALVAFLDFWR